MFGHLSRDFECFSIYTCMSSSSLNFEDGGSLQKHSFFRVSVHHERDPLDIALNKEEGLAYVCWFKNTKIYQPFEWSSHPANNNKPRVRPLERVAGKIRRFQGCALLLCARQRCPKKAPCWHQWNRARPLGSITTFLQSPRHGHMLCPLRVISAKRAQSGGRFYEHVKYEKYRDRAAVPSA